MMADISRFSSVSMESGQQPFGLDPNGQSPTALGPPMKLLSYQDMLSLQDPEWLIEGLMQKRAATLLFGKSNSFKSFVAVDIACTVAASHHVADWHGRPVRGASADNGVLYIATEGALGVAKKRIPGWFDAHEVPKNGRRNIFLYPKEIPLDDEGTVEALIRSCEICLAENGSRQGDGMLPTSIGLVVIDIFGSAMNGTEVSDETARKWVANINRIQWRLGCSTLTVAHTGWGDASRARMHTHFWGSFDTRLKLVGDKLNRSATLTLDRHKDADSSGRWTFSLQEVATPCGDTTLVPTISEVGAQADHPFLSHHQEIAMRALDEALKMSGKRAQSSDFPSCDLVCVADWREECDRLGMSSSDKADSRKKAFNRAKNALKAKGLVAEKDELVWKVSNDA